MEKKPTCLLLHRHIIEHAKNNPEINSFTDWIVDAYTKEFLQDIYLRNKAQKLQEELDSVNTQIKEFKNKGKKIGFTDLELRWVRDNAIKSWEKFDKKAIYNRFKVETGSKMEYRQFRIYTDRVYNGGDKQ